VDFDEAAVYGGEDFQSSATYRVSLDTFSGPISASLYQAVIRVCFWPMDMS